MQYRKYYYTHAFVVFTALLVMAVMTFIGCTSMRAKTRQPGGQDNGTVDYTGLSHELAEYVSGKDARIGIAVIIDGHDTVEVNGRKDFPMMSVVKFPQAIAVAAWIGLNKMDSYDSVAFGANELNENTYSPMLKKYGKRAMKMSWRELLEWSLIESDNNACDILFKQLGGPVGTMDILSQVNNPDNITIGVTEADMQRDHYQSYLNRSTPLAMAELFDRFDRELRYKSPVHSEIALMLERCRTGQDRLAAPLMSTNAIIGHKTGTGFVSADGRISAVNDCGYVHMPDGRRYVIAVFIADSVYDLEGTSRMIAEISGMVWNFLVGR